MNYEENPTLYDRQALTYFLACRRCAGETLLNNKGHIIEYTSAQHRKENTAAVYCKCWVEEYSSQAPTFCLSWCYLVFVRIIQFNRTRARCIRTRNFKTRRRTHRYINILFNTIYILRRALCFLSFYLKLNNLRMF